MAAELVPLRPQRAVTLTHDLRRRVLFVRSLLDDRRDVTASHTLRSSVPGWTVLLADGQGQTVLLLDCSVIAVQGDNHRCHVVQTLSM